MNKTLFLLAAISISIGCLFAQNNDPVLMKINDRPVTKSEFEYLYYKNNTASQQSLDEYLKLFVDYKLKVEEAINQGLDTSPDFLSEYNGYKDQITAPYLADTLSLQAIAKRQYDRLGENIQVSHILIRLPQGQILPKDTLEAYEKAISVRNRIVASNAQPFESVATEYSEDPSVAQSDRPGYLGWASALVFVSPFEDGMYATKIGEVSMPVRSAFGYHLIKVHDRRPDKGKVNVSHIMFAFPERNPSQLVVDSIKGVADRVFARLKAGEDYAALCKEYSTDRRSAENGGDMGWLTAGVGIPEEFMDAVFTLKNTGEFSEPVKTDFGFHIIKLNDRGSRDSWEEAKESLEKRVKGSDLLDKINLMEMKRMEKDYKYALNKNAYNELLQWANDYYPTDSVYLANLKTNNKVLVSINGKDYTYNDFSEYLSKKANLRYTLSTDLVENAVDNFILSKQKDSYIVSLPEKYPEYRNLLKEYHDGILLFNIMNAEIWESAANDTIGLTKYFDNNKNKYTWDSPKYKGYIVYCKDENTVQAAKKLIQGMNPDENVNNMLRTALNNDSVNAVFARKGIWGKGDNTFVDAAAFGEDVEIEPMKDYPHFFVTGKLLNRPEEYADVRGMVISDFQEQKEKEWLDSLRNKYKVEMNDAVLKTIK